MASILNDAKLEALLNRLHEQSDAQIEETDGYYYQREQEVAINHEDYYNEDMKRFLSDKMVALDRDKAEFCYLLCRSLRATRRTSRQLLRQPAAACYRHKLALWFWLDGCKMDSTM